MRVVLLPGLDGCAELRRDFVASLAPSLAVQSISYPNDESQDYAELTKYVAAKLPIQEPYVIIAESFSGPIAISLASTQPSKLAGLVMVASFAKCPIPLIRHLPFLSGFLPLTNRAFINIAVRLLLGRWASRERRQQLQSVLQEVPSDILRSRIIDVVKVDMTPCLEFVSVPLLCIRGAHDLIVTTNAADLILKLSPNAQIRTVNGPHFLLQAVSEESANIVSDFATGLNPQI